MEPVFLGGHPAMDFLNTAFAPQGEHVDVISDGRAFLDWLVRADLVAESTAAGLKRRLSVERLDAVANEARRMRSWAEAWITRWSLAPDADYRAELRRLNAWLRHGTWHRDVQSASGRLAIVELPRVEQADDLLGLIAFQLASLVVREDRALVRRCAGDGCTLWFLDRTKGHRRLFCSASACGNRAKVAAFRARRKGHAM